MIGVRLFFVSLLLLFLLIAISNPSSSQPEFQEDNANPPQMSDTVQQKAGGVSNLPPSKYAPETKHTPSGGQDSYSDESSKDSINVFPTDHFSGPIANEPDTNSTVADTTTADPSQY